MDRNFTGSCGHAPLFEPTRIGHLDLRNRLAVAPMTRVSASAEGVATSQMGRYYSSFAEGGFALLISEGIYTDRAFSQGYLFQPGLTDHAQQAAWAGIVSQVHAHGAKIIAQLMHAGALSQGNRFRDHSRGPSPIKPKGQQLQVYRGRGEFAKPLPLDDAMIYEIVEGFADSAARAIAAGFDGVEIHGANGYLIDQFLTRYTNRREDAYGGSTANRIRLLERIVETARRRIGAAPVLGVRISQGKVNDFAHRWEAGLQDARELFDRLGALPLDYIHTTEFEAWQPAFGQGASLAALAAGITGSPVIANGSLHVPDRALEMVASQGASVVSLGRGALANADWPRRVAADRALSEFDPSILSPIADLANAETSAAARVPGQALSNSRTQSAQR